MGTESRHALQAEIHEVDEYIAEVKARYLGATFRDLAEYNEVGGEIPLPWQVVAIADFPYGWDRESTNVLKHVARNGPRAGVHVVVIVDESSEMPHGVNLTELTENSLVVRNTKGAFRLDEPDLPAHSLTFDAVPRPSDWLPNLIDRLDVAWRRSAEVVVPLEGFKPRRVWTESAAKGITVPIGRSARRQDQFFEANEQRLVNTLVAGQVGTGKTVLLNAIILGTCWRYSPQEVQLYLLDFKEGLGFQVYRDLPHCRVLGLKSEPELGLEVLRELDNERRRRSRLFKQTPGAGGKTVNDIDSYSRATANDPTAEKVPRLLLIFDEFQELTAPAGGFGPDARALVKSLARLGREVGIHLVFATQTPRGSGLEGDTRSQFATRIVLFLEQADSTTVLSPNNSAATTLHRKGEAIYNNQAGDVDGNHRFQVGFMEKDELPRHVVQLARQAQRRGWSFQPQVYDGTQEPSPADAPQIQERLAKGAEPTRPMRLVGVLGAPVDLSHKHEEVGFVRQGGAHLLVVGKDFYQDERTDSAAGCILGACAGLALQAPRDSVHFRVANLMSTDRPNHSVPRALLRLPQQVTLGSRELEAWLTELADSISARSSDPKLRERTEVVVIFALHRASFIVFDFKPTPGAKALRRILQDGADVGIHLIAQAGDRASLLRRLQPRDLGTFGTRVVVSGGGGRQLFGPTFGPEECEPEYGWIERDEHLGSIRKFRPYALRANME